MKLPNADRAIIDMRKLTEYSLNLRHRHGKEKALLFRDLLGLTLENAQILYDALTDAVRTYDAEETDDIGPVWAALSDRFPDGDASRFRNRTKWLDRSR